MPTKTAAPKTAKPKAGAANPANPTTAKTAPKPEVKPVAMQAAGAPPAESTELARAKVTQSLRVKDLVERVAAAGAFKKKDVRDIVEATLVELGRALEDGYSLNLPPFGKMHIRNSRATDNGISAMTLKLRRGPSKTTGAKVEKEALAEAGEAV